ncbi:MAG: photosystem I reaction center subunit XII [Aphanocapsa feldmannii 277cV]|uniref:Photosystem I reaction center subunit XII n=1 Tax=Aphanocapsa feldmannii 277cV TaxID=2507553 RepID=A0A524RLR1_9CHRO|nr:MAG: photosystem I reaction center subunit XII [Aphanocapsa feldmannii 277cV]
MPLWLESESPAELFAQRSETELQDTIRRVYRQVLGNISLTGYERCSQAESLLRNGSSTVREFVSAVGLSETYRDLYFAPNGQYRFIELNFKHFLGRAPRNQQEISEHVLIWNTHGYEAEILSYINSEEYAKVFGEDIVPYPRTDTSEIGQNKDYIRTINLDRGRASSDRKRGTAAILQTAINSTASADAPRTINNGVSNRLARFEVVYSLSRNTAVNRRAGSHSQRVDFDQLTKTVQSIHRRGGSIRSIRPIA